jgi:hypothetical protein
MSMLVLVGLTFNTLWTFFANEKLQTIEFGFAVGVGAVLFIFFLLTTILFLEEAKRNYHAEYVDHKRRYRIQALGMAIAILTDVAMNSYYLYLSLNSKLEAHQLDSHIQEASLLIRNVAGFIFVLSKTPKDCFLCFSKLKNIKYSIWQFVEYIYTEQMLMIRRNAYLLTELQKLAEGKGKMVVLDADDYLNPLLAKDAHRIGIDMEFMVRYVGGDQLSDSDSEFTDDDYDEEEPNELKDSSDCQPRGKPAI